MSVKTATLDVYNTNTDEEKKKLRRERMKNIGKAALVAAGAITAAHLASHGDDAFDDSSPKPHLGIPSLRERLEGKYPDANHPTKKLFPFSKKAAI